MGEPTKTVLGEFTAWTLDGELHREDGPAIEWTDGSRFWFLDGFRHREDEPAHFNETQSFERWSLFGKLFTEKEFWKRVYHD